MNGHDTAFSQIAPPVLVSVLIIYTIFQIIWQQILELQRSAKLEVDFRIFSAEESGEKKR
jgi:hypothetical protein